VSWTKSAVGTNDKIFEPSFLLPLKWAGQRQTMAAFNRTKDGTTWEKEDLGITSDVRAIHFIDTLHGWACGSGNTILAEAVGFKTIKRFGLRALLRMNRYQSYGVTFPLLTNRRVG